jgi:hypothetical protein
LSPPRKPLWFAPKDRCWLTVFACPSQRKRQLSNRRQPNARDEWGGANGAAPLPSVPCKPKATQIATFVRRPGHGLQSPATQTPARHCIAAPPNNGLVRNIASRPTARPPLGRLASSSPTLDFVQNTVDLRYAAGWKARGSGTSSASSTAISRRVTSSSGMVGLRTVAFLITPWRTSSCL